MFIEQAFISTLITLSGTYILFWIIFKIFNIYLPGVPSLLSIIVSFVLAPFHPYAVVTAIPLFILGYRSGRSTSVPKILTDILSPLVKLSDEEYARQSEQHMNWVSSIDSQKTFSSPNLHWTEKLPLLMRFVGYRNIPFTALGMSLGYITIWSSVIYSGGFIPYFLLFILSLPFGTAIGTLWLYIKGHRRK